MKTQIFHRPVMPGVLKSLFSLLILAACSEEPEVLPIRPEQSSTIAEDVSDARRRDPNAPNYNLNVLLLPTEKCSGLGFIKFRQNVGETQLIHLDTWVHGLQPNTNYLLQRAVDTTLDGNCTGTTWLTLGKGLDPFPITTNNWGIGKAELFRSVSTIPVGSTFDIHFQIIKESTLEVVLTSDCYQYTVR